MGPGGWEGMQEAEDPPLFEVLSAREVYQLLCKYSHLMDDAQVPLKPLLAALLCSACNAAFAEWVLLGWGGGWLTPWARLCCR